MDSVTFRTACRRLPALAGVTIALALAACGGDDDNATDPNALPPVAALQATCAAMVGKTYASATVTAATRMEANAALSAPGMCQVLATRAPYLDIEVVVPDNWSGRYWQQGGAGFDGRIPSALTKSANGTVMAVNLAITSKGVVYAASNGGNRSGVAGQAAPAVWVDGTADGAKSATDYAYQALGTTLQVAKGVIQEFFARDAKYRYFNGCSNGGRNAYIAIERWPNEYDGVVSGCEGMDMAAQTVAWMDMASLNGTPAMPTAPQWTSVYQAAVASCDAADNLTDGIIANYSKCAFDPATLVCGEPLANADPAVCLTTAQLSTVNRLLGTLTSTTGNVIYEGYGWANWNPTGFGGLGSGFVALATNDATWLTPAKIATFDVNLNYGPVAAGLQSIGADHDKIAIAAFVSGGKKLINWHDGADGLLSINDHARNLTTMHAIAKSNGLADVSTNSRFFIVPGTSHGGGSPLMAVDWSDAIVKWVESGAAPSQLIYNTTSAGVAKTLPVCQYPTYPRYMSGDVMLAASYACTAP